jgi:uncharacterized protein YdhG (YjbR/CyaY superfamily)
MVTPSSVDAYLAALTPDRRARLAALRRTIIGAAPGATETIAYQMPALRLDGRFFMSYAAFKVHDSLFPASDAVVAGLGRELEPYLAGKGTIRFPVSEPIPIDLVARIVAIRLVEHAAPGKDR